MKFYYLNLLAAAFSLASCSPELEVDQLHDFSVRPEKQTYKVGEEVNFLFEGNPGHVTFYSGELYQQYAYKDGRKVEAGPVTFSFTTGVQSGTQANQLSVLASTDFNGNYDDFAGVQAATWTDISNSIQYGTNTTFRASGGKDITSLLVAGKPVYLAFKYQTKPQAANGDARLWMIQNVLLSSQTTLGTLTLEDMLSAGFRLVKPEPMPAPDRSATTATRISLYANEYTPESDPASEIWAISKPIHTKEVVLPPDLPLTIKGNADEHLEKFTYVYTQPGTYKVAFVAINRNIDNSAKAVKELEITVEP
ncbi:MAG: DUF5017 domain-containing protein [Adhaeribacter sp.]